MMGEKIGISISVVILCLLTMLVANAQDFTSFERVNIYTVSNTGNSTLTDYQIAIVINTTQLISEGKLRSDCGDLRVYDANYNLLPYWIEDNTCNTNYTRIWTKLTLPTGNTTIFVAYGNSNITSQSNGDAVFEFFDDFNAGSLNTSKWNGVLDHSGGSYAVANGELKLDACFVLSKNYIMSDGILMFRARATSGYEISALARSQSNTSYTRTYLVQGSTYTNYQHIIEYLYSTGTSRLALNTTPISAGTPYIFEFILSGTYLNYTRYNLLRTPLVTVTATHSAYTSGYVGLKVYGMGSGNRVSYYDWVAVRKYASPEPTVSFVASSEIIIIESFDVSRSPNTINVNFSAISGIYYPITGYIIKANNIPIYNESGLNTTSLTRNLSLPSSLSGVTEAPYVLKLEVYSEDISSSTEYILYDQKPRVFLVNATTSPNTLRIDFGLFDDIWLSKYELKINGVKVYEENVDGDQILKTLYLPIEVLDNFTSPYQIMIVGYDDALQSSNSNIVTPTDTPPDNTTINQKPQITSVMWNVVSDKLIINFYAWDDYEIYYYVVYINNNFYRRWDVMQKSAFIEVEIPKQAVSQYEPPYPITIVVYDIFRESNYVNITITIDINYIISSPDFNQIAHAVMAYTVMNDNDFDVSYYQVRIPFDTKTYILSGRLRSDCGNIRVYDYNGRVLPYYIENCGETNAYIWTRVSLPAYSSGNVYVYIGGLSMLSNETPNIFDPFEPRLENVFPSIEMLRYDVKENVMTPIQGLIRTVFGDPILFGVVFLIVISTILYVSRVPFDTSVAIASILTIAFAGVFLPMWVAPLVIIGIAILIAIGFMKLLEMR